VTERRRREDGAGHPLDEPVRELSDHAKTLDIKDPSGTEVSLDLISWVTEAVLDEVREWQN
jgi:hypothetical protein